MKILILILCLSIQGCLKAKKSPFDINGGGSFINVMVLNAVSNQNNRSIASNSNALQYIPNTVTITKGFQMADMNPKTTENFSSFSANKSLPNGLVLNGTTGVISGTATVNQAEATYSILAKNSTTSATTDVKITVTSDPPSNLSYNGSSSGLVSGSTSSNLIFRRTVTASISPTISGSASFSVSPSLPSGLSLNSSSGIISGTATVSQTASNYIVTATNQYGSTQITLSISVLPVIYAATFGGGLAISTDGGNTFTMKTVANSGLGCDTQNIVSVDLNGNIYSGNNSNSCTGGISVSSNNGTSFSLLSGLSGLQIFSESVPSAGTIYAGAFDSTSGFYFSTNSGSSFTQRTGTSYFASNYINDIYSIGTNVYVANGFSGTGGVSISSDGGNSFTKYNNANGLPANTPVSGVYAVGSTIYAATSSGLYISTNGGTTFTLSGMTGSAIKVFVSSGIIYVASSTGVYISTNAGASFSNKTTASGLPSNSVNSIYVYLDGSIYAGTSSGIGISTDGGNTFTVRNGANGLTNLNIQSVFLR